MLGMFAPVTVFSRPSRSFVLLGQDDRRSFASTGKRRTRIPVAAKTVGHGWSHGGTPDSPTPFPGRRPEVRTTVFTTVTEWNT
jgi:hypothetical protein